MEFQQWGLEQLNGGEIIAVILNGNTANGKLQIRPATHYCGEYVTRSLYNVAINKEPIL